MIALGGPKLKLGDCAGGRIAEHVSMIALGGPKLKLVFILLSVPAAAGFNDSTGWA